MSHTLFWAATPTLSDGLADVHHKDGGMIGEHEMPKNFDATQFGPMLLSREGLDMLVRYGQLTPREKEGLVASGLPPSQYPYVLLEWAGLRTIDGIEKGELRGGPGMEENLLRQLSMLRGEYFNIGGKHLHGLYVVCTFQKLTTLLPQIMELVECQWLTCK